MLLTLLIVLVLMIVFDLAALRWGANSADKPDSCEWERRWNSTMFAAKPHHS